MKCVNGKKKEKEGNEMNKGNNLLLLYKSEYLSKHY